MEAGKYYSFSISLESARLALCLSTNGDLFTIQLCHQHFEGVTVELTPVILEIEGCFLSTLKRIYLVDLPTFWKHLYVLPDSILCAADPEMPNDHHDPFIRLLLRIRDGLRQSICMDSNELQLLIAEPASLDFLQLQEILVEQDEGFVPVGLRMMARSKFCEFFGQFWAIPVSHIERRRLSGDISFEYSSHCLTLKFGYVCYFELE